jgi:hypothetical protein
MAQISALVLTTSILFCQVGGEQGSVDGSNPSTHSSPSTSASTALRPETQVLKAIKGNPAIAPYEIKTTWQKGAVLISGRVGSTAIHDLVIQTAIDLGYPFRDALMIDTAEAVRVASQRTKFATGSREMEASDTYTQTSQKRSSPAPLIRIENDTFPGSWPPEISYPPDWKRSPSQDREKSGYSVDPTAAFSARQKALFENGRRQLANPEPRARLNSDSSRDLARKNYALDRDRRETRHDGGERIGEEYEATNSDDTGVPNQPLLPVLFVLSVILLVFTIYFLPSIIASCRGHHNLAAIIALNLFLGWTFLGWVAAIVWALTQVERQQHVAYRISKPSYVVDPGDWLS